MSENREAYESFQARKAYTVTAEHGLTPQEAYCLSLVPSEERGSVLDIGFGGGRTTPALRQLFITYVGIDYSSALVELSQTKYPGVDFRFMDARDLNFQHQFDCIMFSFNGIDSVSLEGRSRIIEGVKRSLKLGGYFVYSTHNAGYHRVPVWMSRLLVKELFVPFKKIRCLPHRLYFFSRQRAISRNCAYLVNDPGLGFRLLNMYVTIESEILTLEALGFEVVATIGNQKTAPTYDANDCWVYLVARKKNCCC